MAHTDRQPSDEIFEDIKTAGIRTWWSHRDLHEDYIKEKVDNILRLSNYADNWYSIIGAMDGINQMILWHQIKKQATVDFLREMRVHYGYFVAKEKE